MSRPQARMRAGRPRCVSANGPPMWIERVYRAHDATATVFAPFRPVFGSESPLPAAPSADSRHALFLGRFGIDLFHRFAGRLARSLIFAPVAPDFLERRH